MAGRALNQKRKSVQPSRRRPSARTTHACPGSLAQFYSQYQLRRAGAHTHPFGPAACHQTTLARKVSCAGVGLHSGAEVRMVLRPAPADSGIVFIRRDSDLPDRSEAVIPALFSQVCQSTLCSTLGAARGASVRTVEHVMAALAGLGVDNAYIELDGPEVPVMDGSAAPFVAMIDRAGLAAWPQRRRVLKITKPVRVESGDGFCELRPSRRLMLDSEIDFPEAAIGRQRLRMVLNEENFRRSLAPARTFCRARDVAGMRAAGLALGGSLDNAVVVDGAAILNADGLRYHDEFVRHKLLDALGDLYLAGLPVLGHYRGRKAGHTLHNKLLHAVFAARAFALLELTPPRTAAGEGVVSERGASSSRLPAAGAGAPAAGAPTAGAPLAAQSGS